MFRLFEVKSRLRKQSTVTIHHELNTIFYSLIKQKIKDPHGSGFESWLQLQANPSSAVPLDVMEIWVLIQYRGGESSKEDMIYIILGGIICQHSCKDDNTRKTERVALLV